MIDYIGILGSILLAICGAPQCYTSFKTKNSDGVSALFLWLWGVGEILILIYVMCTTMDPILIVNYVFNLIVVGIIAYYKLPRKGASNVSKTTKET